MILKLLVCFSEKRVIKDQMVVTEGERPGQLYIVKEGEFELMKKVNRTKKVDIDYDQFISIKDRSNLQK